MRPVILPSHRYDPKADPSVGARLHLPATDYKGVGLGLSRHQANLIVVCGSCSTCSLRVFNPKSLDPRSFGSILLVYETHRDELSPQLTNLNGKFHIVCDEDGVFAKALNASWTPRFYLADPDGTLLALQTRDTQTATDLLALVENK